MSQYTPQVDPFNQQLQVSLRQATQQWPALRFAKDANIYIPGDQDANIYFIESGQVKVVKLAPDGRECLLELLTTGDLFGELCLAGLDERQERTTAMMPTIVHALPCAQFLLLLNREGLLQGFIRYLAIRLTDQQETITDLLSVDSEQRLGKTLLQLAHKLGKPDPRSIRIEQRITHQELADMIGTTRSRVCTFMHRFLELGLVEFSAERFLIIKEAKLNGYVAQCTKPSATYSES